MAYEKLYNHFRIKRVFSIISKGTTYSVTNKNGYFVMWENGSFVGIVPKSFTFEQAINNFIGA
jgi:hypothetical protein